MEPLLIVANLKSNKDESEAKNWFITLQDQVNSQNKQIIVCPSFVHLPALSVLNNQKIKLGAQDISPFPEGAYTGEVNGKQIKEYAEFVLVGHSERRDNFKEDQAALDKKVGQALKYGLKPIYCMQNQDQDIPEGVEIIAYEPVFAIGTGNSDTPENAQNVALKIKQKKPEVIVLYGGSVTPQNVRSFTDLKDINGVLVGSASLDVQEFSKIIELS